MKRKIRACLLAMFVCFLLATIKYFFGVYSGSVALKADALHSFLDMFTSFLVLVTIVVGSISFKSKSAERAAKAFEISIALFIVGLVVFLGISVLDDLRSAETELTRPFAAIFATLVSLVINFFLFRYQRKVGREEKSKSILADAFETKMDFVTSSLVLVSVVASMVGLRAENTFVTIILCVVAFNTLAWLLENVYGILTNRIVSFGSILSKAVPYISLGMDELKKSYVDHKRNFNISLIVISLSMAFIYLLSGFYTVRPGQIAVVQYFGKHISNLGSTTGLNYSLPYPFSQKVILDVDQIKRIEVGVNKGRSMRYFITKDENLVDVAISIQYKISDVYQYAFNASDVDRILKDLLESVTIEIVGKFDIDETLVHGKQKVLDEVRSILRERLEQYKIGINVLNVQFKKNAPPREVIRAFNDVSSAREDKKTAVDNAYGYRNKILPDARGASFEMIQKAESFKEKLIQSANGDVERLERIYKQYKKSPYVYRSNEFLRVMDLLSKNARFHSIDPKSAKKIKLRVIPDN